MALQSLTTSPYHPLHCCSHLWPGVPDRERRAAGDLPGRGRRRRAGSTVTQPRRLVVGDVVPPHQGGSSGARARVLGCPAGKAVKRCSHDDGHRSRKSKECTCFGASEVVRALLWQSSTAGLRPAACTHKRKHKKTRSCRCCWAACRCCSLLLGRDCFFSNHRRGRLQTLSSDEGPVTRGPRIQGLRQQACCRRDICCRRPQGSALL